MPLNEQQRARLHGVLYVEDDSFVALMAASGLRPDRDFRFADWRDVDFGDADLTGFDFTGADLTGANLSRARGLQGAVFVGARGVSENTQGEHADDNGRRGRPPAEVAMLCVGVLGAQPRDAKSRKSAQRVLEELLRMAIAEIRPPASQVLWNEDGQLCVLIRDTIPTALDVAAAFARALEEENSVQRLRRRLDVVQGLHVGGALMQSHDGLRYQPDAVSDGLRLLSAAGLPGQVVCSGGFRRQAVEAGIEAADFTLLPEVVSKHGESHEVWNVAREPGFGITPADLRTREQQDADRLRRQGDALLAQFDFVKAERAYEGALAAYQAVRDTLGEADCHRSLGHLALAMSQFDRAQLSYELALDIYLKRSSLPGAAESTLGVANVMLGRTKNAAAEEGYAQALALYRQLGSGLGEANCIKGLGDVALSRSQISKAREAFAQALELYRVAGSQAGKAASVKSLGDVAFARANLSEAEDNYQQALALSREVGALRCEADSVVGLGDVARQHGHAQVALNAFHEAGEIYRRIGDSRGAAATHARIQTFRPRGPQSGV